LPVTERFEQPSLARDHVADGEAWKRQIRLARTVARRRREPVADRVRADDEVAVRIKRTAGSDQKIQPVVRRADCRLDENDLVGRALPVRDIADLEIANDFAAFERQFAQLQRLMRAIDLAGLRLRMRPAWLAKAHPYPRLMLKRVIGEL